MNQISSIKNVLLTFLLGATAMLAGTNAFAATYTINTTADSGPGSLRDALTQANANPGADTINFAPALTASSPATISLTSALPAITESLTITGPGQSKLTVKNGIADPNNPFVNLAGSFRVFTVAVDAPGVVSFSGLTVSNGAVFEGNIIDQSGGGILNAGTGTLNLTDSAIINNFAELSGGGIINLRTGILNLTRCTVSGNSTFSGNGGGVANGGVLSATPGGTLRIIESLISDNHTLRNGGGIFTTSTQQGGFYLTNSTVTGNTASSAGGIWASGDTTVSIAGCTISDNQGTTGGSGGLTLAATANIINSTISGNTVGSLGSFRGGGIQVLGRTVNITNCTLANNQALGPTNATGLGGGAIAVSPGTGIVVTIKNSTISGNSSNAGPGGIGNFSHLTFFGTVNLSSSIVVANTSIQPAEDVGNIFPLTSQGYNVIGDNELSPVAPIAGDQVGVTVAQLNLAALADNGGLTKTMALLPGSVALDKGIGNGLTTDQRGYGRAFDNAAVANGVDGADVGAFEAQSLTFVVTKTADAGPGSLRDALTQANLNPDADTITFAIPTSDPGYDAASQRWTISLTSALPVISDSVTISGPGKDKLTVKNGLVDPLDPFGILVDPNNPTYNPAIAFRVFTIAVDAPGVVSVSGLTASNGFPVDPNTAIARYGGGILNLRTGTLNVTDCAITGNTVEYGGGGIANHTTGTLNVTRCTISDNGWIVNWTGAPGGIREPFPYYGGGISNGGDYDYSTQTTFYGGTVRVVDSVISGNGGGGVSSPRGGSVTLINTVVSANKARYYGGGLYAAGGSTVSVANSIISDNQSFYAKTAGGIMLDHVTAEVTNSTLSGNSTSVYGGTLSSLAAGGIFLAYSDLSLTNCTLTNNQGTQFPDSYDPRLYGATGGAIATGGSSTLNVRNCTISGNSSTNGAGGILNHGRHGANLGDAVNIQSSILAGNSSVVPNPNPYGVGLVFPITSQGYNVIGTNELTPVTPVGGDQAGVTAAQLSLGPLANNGGPTQTMALGLGSVAINRGFANAALLPNDQRGAGFARIVGAAADVGAFEVQNTAPVARAKNITVPAGSNCQASITPQQVDNGSFDPDSGDTLILSLDQSGPFAIGTRTVTLTATDRQNLSSSAAATVTVVDMTPPLINSVTANPNTLKPADHKLKPVTLAVNASDGCGGAITSKITSVTFVDPAKGDKADDDARKMKPAFQLTGDLSVKLLAGPKGRVYTLTVTSTDSAGNAATKTTSVTVAPPPPPPPPRH